MGQNERRERSYSYSPVVNDEVRSGKLVRVEQERRDAQRQNRHPEVRDPSRPDRQRHVKQHDQSAHAKVDTRSGEARVEDSERDPGRCKATSGRDVPGATESQVRDDRVRRNLGGEDLERRGQRPKVLRETNDGLDGSALNQLCRTE